MVKAAKGVLIQCDPSIKAIINKIDEKYHDFIIEDLDDETVVVKETKLYELKQKLADVRMSCCDTVFLFEEVSIVETACNSIMLYCGFRAVYKKCPSTKEDV